MKIIKFVLLLEILTNLKPLKMISEDQAKQIIQLLKEISKKIRRYKCGRFQYRNIFKFD